MTRSILLGAMLLRGCATTPSEVPLGGDFVLAIGQTVRLAGTSTTVRLEAVPQDSRCPATVQCVWAGNAEVRLLISAGPAPVETSVNTGVEPRAATVGDLRIELLDLTPSPITGSAAIPSTEYRARLRASRR